MPDPRPELAPAVVTAQLRALGVREGGVLLVHMSFRAVRPVAGGPLGLIAALREALGPDGTLVMPSDTGDDDTLFDPATTPVTPDLGATADLFWRLPGVKRTDHFCGYAASGPAAEQITAAPGTAPPSAPGSAIDVVRELDGQVLLLGVGHDANTTVHLAELLGGVPYGVPRHYTALRGGRPVRVDYLENDHCCERFALLDDWLRAEGLQREGTVGHAEARLANARDVVRIAVAHLREDPLVFLHPEGEGCDECDEARASCVTC